MYENDFIKNEAINFEIDGKKFSYTPVTGGQENDWLNEYMSINEEGKVVQNFARVNRCKARNIVSVPYDKETINTIINVNKEWKELNEDERWKLLSQLSPSLFDKLFEEIKNIDQPSSLKKKS